jgi:hypothetical protein
MKKFIDLSMDAVIHGYTILLKDVVTFRLIAEPRKNFKSKYKKVYFTSDKCIDYMFSIQFQFRGSSRLSCKFAPDKIWAERLQEILDSDKIYELIKQ